MDRLGLPRLQAAGHIWTLAKGASALKGEMTAVVRRVRTWIKIAGWAALMAVPISTTSRSAENSRPSIAFVEFSFKDTSGEVRDQRAEHRTKLELFTRLLREHVEVSGKFAIAQFECRSDDCVVENGVASPALMKKAAQMEARYLVVGGIQKMSTLVQWARVTVLDLKNQTIAHERLYTFRGDTEGAWRHAALFVARHINEMASKD